VTVIALVAALGGGAVAGVAATSLNKKDKKQVTKIAKKQAKKLDKKIELAPGPRGAIGPTEGTSADFYSRQGTTLTRQISAGKSDFTATRAGQLLVIKPYYGLIDVFVVPRTSEATTELVTPLKPFEAMAMEKAVVVSATRALSEIVADGETGFTFVPEDAGDLAAKVGLLIDSEELARRGATPPATGRSTSS
jgi:glycosyltransferase involved in cell wall biosynthesis